MPVPQLDNKPSILGYEWFYEAFVLLNTCRQIGMTFGPIPWTSVEHYAIATNLNADDKYFLHQIVSHLDEVYLKHMQEKTQSGRA